MSDRPLPLKEAGERIAASRAKLYDLSAKGLIEMRRIGGRTFILESEIQRILRDAPVVHSRRPQQNA
jgi:hypothetical protein